MNIPGFSPALARTGAAEIWLSGPLPAKVQLVVKKVKKGKGVSLLGLFLIIHRKPKCKISRIEIQTDLFSVLKINECFCAPTRICQTTPDAQAKQPPSLASR